MGKVDLKEELAIQAAAVEENNNAVKLTRNMSIQDMVKAMMPEIKKALPSVITPERFTRIALSALNNHRLFLLFFQVWRSQYGKNIRICAGIFAGAESGSSDHGT